jgi:4-amino-4-deoxy-L-arabinose transferase-like glycosyltransferase
MSIPAAAERPTSVIAAQTDAVQPAVDGGQMAPAGDAKGIWLWPLAIWLTVTATTLVARPPIVAADLPIHAVAWWAWTGRQDIVYLPHAGAEWPPLLFWCIRLGWSLFGVGETWARLAPSLFGLASLWLIVRLARRLWPGDKETPRYAPIVLAGSGGFIAFLATTMFAWPLLAASILGLHGIVLAWRRRPVAGWAAYAVALALGELSAGALAFWILVPIALAAPLAVRGFGAAALGRWYAGAVVATAAGLAATAALDLAPFMPPAAGRAGNLLARLLLHGPLQSANLDQPWLWYVFVTALLLFPWLWWTSLWWAARRGHAQFATAELRLCLSAAALIFLVVLIAGQQTGDLLPLLAPATLVIARIWVTHAGKARDFHAAVPGLLALFVCLFFFMLNIVPVAHLDAVWQRLFASDLPPWLGGISLAAGITLLSGSYLLALLTPRTSLARLIQMALLPVLLALTVNLEFAVSLRPFFDVTPLAQQIHALAQTGPIAVYGHYDGQFDLAGRLDEPPEVLHDTAAALTWAEQNPSGVIVSFFRGGILHLPEKPLYLGHAEDFRAALWANATVTATHGAVLRSRF